MTDFPVARPGLPYRIFLSWLKRAAKGRDGLPMPDYLTPESLAALRRMTGMPSFPQGLSALQIKAWRTLDIPCGDHVRSARLYRPRGEVTGVILFLHGGGFVHCDLVSHHGMCCRLARHAGAMVLSLDYRLAPEHPYPAAVEDGWAALKWLDQQAGMRDLPIAVCGDSAGGNLAAVLARRAGVEGMRRVVAQLLYYPTVSGLWSPSSRAVYAEGFMLTARLLDWYGRQYIRRDRDMLDPDFAPVFADDLSAAPPAMIVTAGFDPLRGEGELYATLLREAGVRVRLVCCAKAIHGFLNFYAVVVEGRRALRLGGAYLRAQFARHRKAQ